MAAAAAKTRKDSTKENLASKCNICEKNVGERDLGVQCELCEGWYHASCSGVAEIYPYLGKIENLHWFCNQCNKNVKKTLYSLSKMEERINKVESDVETMKNEKVRLGSELRKLEKDLNGFKAEIDETLSKFSQDIKDSQKTVVETEIKSVVGAELGFREIQVQQLQESLSKTKEFVEEEQDKESRRNNIVLYRVPETDDETVTDRVSADKKFCEQLFNKLNVGFDPEDIRKIFRLGRRVEDDRSQRERSPRPILVELGSYAIKNLIMHSLFKLKSMENRFKSIIISHDMTKSEREHCKVMVEEAKEKSRNETGDFIYRVRGPPGRMQIVRLRKIH